MPRGIRVDTRPIAVVQAVAHRCVGSPTGDYFARSTLGIRWSRSRREVAIGRKRLRIARFLSICDVFLLLSLGDCRNIRAANADWDDTQKQRRESVQPRRLARSHR